jgi:AraC-like DNA-binding protein
MSLSLDGLAYFGLSQAILSLTALIFARPHTVGIRLLFLFYLCIAADLLSDIVDVSLSGGVVAAVSSFGHNLLPGIFWLTCLSLFGDRFRLASWQVVVVGFVIFIPLFGEGINSVATFELASTTWFQWLFFTLPQWLQSIVVVLAIYTIASNWQDDLIQVRRQLRVYLLGVAGVEISVMLLVIQVYGYIPEPMAQVILVVLDLQLILVNLAIMRGDLRVLVQPTSPVLKGNTEDSKDETLDLLLRTMEQQRIYRQEGLTIAQLAHHLTLPEARLRQLINQKLGYRNFNDFLNDYRVAEITERFESPSQDRLPIMSIALDVGYGSMSPFNRAFKSAHGVTPSDYRRAILKNRLAAPN